jgi:hypothetical protein
MYDRQVDERGIFKPGACAKFDATKMTEQSRCRHPFDQLKWGANGKSVYASCGACGLKTCVMYSRADAFVAEAEEDVKDVHVVHLTPGLVMMDTGCRAAVGGTSWHRQLQKVLKRMGRKFHSEEQLEFFQFGPGDPIQSTRCWHYEVGVVGQNRVLRISEVQVECPGLVGPTELSAWQMMLNFQDKTFTSEGRVSSIIYARSGHPCMSLLDYQEALRSVHQTESGQADSDEDLPASSCSSLRTAAAGWRGRRSPCSPAAGERRDPSAEEDELGDTPPDSPSPDTELEELLRRTSAKVEDSDEPEDLPPLVKEPSDEETEEDESDENGGFAAGAQEEEGKYMSKGAYRHVRAAMKIIREGMSAEKAKAPRSIPKEETLAATPVGPRRAGPWRIVETFTWMCVVTAVAHQMGGEAYKPITLPWWDVSRPEVRVRAREYLVEMDPEYVVLAPPCGPWSQGQMLNLKTPRQVRE